MHVSVAAKRPTSTTIQKGGLYRLDAAEQTWTEVSTGIDLGGATLAPMDYAFDASGNIYLCTADVQLSNGGGGVYMRDSSTQQWTNLHLREAVMLKQYWDRLVAFAPYIIAGNLWVTTITHGIWKNVGGVWSEQSTNVPFLGAQRITLDVPNSTSYIATFGGGVWKVPPASSSPPP